MSNVSAFAILILILSPLLLPLAISGVHAFAELRRNLRIAPTMSGPESRAVTSD
jgi:hypothetical protein